MDCHESLMARRRKKTARNAAARQKAQNAVHLDKSLPSLPPTAPEVSFSPEVDMPSPDPSFHEQIAEVPPRKRPTDRRQGSSGRTRKEESPNLAQNQFRGLSMSKHISQPLLTVSIDGLTLPTNGAHNKRHSVMSQRSDMSGGDEFLIPVAFDPTPPAAQTPQMSQKASKYTDDRARDYFSGSRGSAANTNRHVENNHTSQTSSPHIAYQEKDSGLPNDPTDTSRRRREIANHANGVLTSSRGTRDGSSEDRFKLQDVPKGKRSGGSPHSSRSESLTPRSEAVIPTSSQANDSKVNGNEIPSNMSVKVALESAPRLSNEIPSRGKTSFDGPSDSRIAGPSATNAFVQPPPRRGDSLESARYNHLVSRKEVTQSNPMSEGIIEQQSERVNKKSESSAPIDEPRISHSIDPPRNKSINDQSSRNAPTQQNFDTPRIPPQPPVDMKRNRNESISTMQSDTSKNNDKEASPGLPRWSAGAAGGQFTMDEDMARIWAGDDSQQQDSFLRRVSNSVRHGRSFSDKGARLSKEPKWPRSPAMTGQFEISSPITASPENKEDLARFKNELRKERQKNVERDQKIAELEAALDSAANIKQVNFELREKRSTMVVLDSQKEIVVRELEVLTEHIAAAKKSGEPIDLGKMSGVILRDFAKALQKLKDSFAPQIEESIQQRNDLVEEISRLTQAKDKSFQEFEQLSLKNAQLAELNNTLVHQIQSLYKANTSTPSTTGTEAIKPPTNGLGIYHHKEKSQISIDGRENRPSMNDMSLPGSQSTIQPEEAEPVTVLQGPQMVNIRKAQPKKFNWKKGGTNMAKGVTKGLKGAFTSTQQSYNREMQFAETGSYSSSLISQELPPRQGPPEPPRQGFGFFSGQKPPSKGSKDWRMQSNGSSTALGVDAATSKLMALQFVYDYLLITISPFRIRLRTARRVREISYPRYCLEVHRGGRAAR